MPNYLSQGWSRVESWCWSHDDTAWEVFRCNSGPNRGLYWINKALEDDFYTHTISGETVYCHTLIEAQRLVLKLTERR